MNCQFGRRSLRGAFTLVEVVISTAIVGLTMGGVIYGYVMSAKMAEWASYHLAAQAYAIQRMEQARSAKWDTQTPVDLLVATNFPVLIDTLDIPISRTNFVYVTNVTTITTVATNPLLRMIRVDCSWKFINNKVFTNTIASYRAPDQ